MTPTRCEIRTTTDNELLAVEVKSNESIQLIFNEHGVATLSIEIVESNTLSRVVRKAASQLRNGPAEALRLICYVAAGMEAEAKLSQLRATLYGLVDVIEFPKTTRVTPCFYFDHSAFFRHDCISGALLVQVPRCAALRQCLRTTPRRSESKLYETLAQANAIRDPIDEESKGYAYSICDAVDRRDDKVRLEYLSKKYSTGKLLALRWNANIGVGQNDLLLIMDSPTAKVPRPDYRPWCLRDLEHVLGAADAVMEWTEVSSRNLKREQDAHGPSRVE